MKEQHPQNFPDEEESRAPKRFQEQPERILPPVLSLTSFLDFSPDALLVIDSAGRIILLNAQTEVLFGYGEKELIGQSLEVLLPERFRRSHIAERQHYLLAPVARPMGTGLDLVGRRKDGSEFPVDISLRPLRSGQALQVVAAIRDVTAQRQAEQERATLTEHLRQQNKLINLSHDAILIRDPQSRIISWNRGAKDLYGWEEQEVVGQVTHSLLSTQFSEPLEMIERHLEHDGHWDGDLTHRSRTGRQIIVESRQVLVRDAEGRLATILEINRDVTERRRLEHLEQEVRSEMKAHLDMLQLILDRLSTGVFLVQGSQARLLLANRAAIELWGAEWARGQPLEAFLSQQHVQLLSGEGRPLPEGSLAQRAIVSGEPLLHTQIVICHSDGTRLPVLVDAIPLGLLRTGSRLPMEMAAMLAPSEPVVLMVYQDVTALKETEALKDQFISIATHELRTPVTVLAGYTDLLLKQAARSKDRPLDEAQAKKLCAMKEATLHLAKLTEDLLEITRVQAGQFQLQRSPTDLVALTQQIMNQFQAITSQHHLVFQTSLARLWASVDACRIEQVLSNLLMNAMKYSPKGGPIEVMLWEERQAHEACFSVSDQGMGIPQEQQAHIFGRFVRAKNVQAAHINGTGLGLFLCRELVERHGGRISFQSEEGVGTTFFFTLPCNTVAK